MKVMLTLDDEGRTGSTVFAEVPDEIWKDNEEALIDYVNNELGYYYLWIEEVKPGQGISIQI